MAAGQRADQLWSSVITYLLTSLRGIWPYLYLVDDVWSRKVMAWIVAEQKDADRR